jgi:hypothetical protein
MFQAVASRLEYRQGIPQIIGVGRDPELMSMAFINNGLHDLARHLGQRDPGTKHIGFCFIATALEDQLDGVYAQSRQLTNGFSCFLRRTQFDGVLGAQPEIVLEECGRGMSVDTGQRRAGEEESRTLDFILLQPPSDLNQEIGRISGRFDGGDTNERDNRRGQPSVHRQDSRSGSVR